MHARNGRELKNGDKVVQLGTRYVGDTPEPVITAVGVLHDAKPGNDYCNGSVAATLPQVSGACMCDCLHMDDLMALVKAAGLDKRPAGK